MHSTEIQEKTSGSRRQAKTWMRLVALSLIIGLIATLVYITTTKQTTANDDPQYLSNPNEDPLEFELKIDQSFPMENVIAPPFAHTSEQSLDEEPLLGIGHLIDSPLSPVIQKIGLPTNSSSANPEEQNLFNLTLESMEQASKKKVEQTKNKIVILKVVDYRDKQFLKIDSNSRIQLNDKIFDAINHEINLNFKIQMQLTEANRLLGIPYQRTRKSINYHVKLLSEGLDQTFHLYNSRNGHTQSFRDLDDAFETLSTIKAFEIAELSELHPRQIYTLRMRISLDIWKLPTPLLLEALFTDHWQLDSGWFETTLKAPQSWQ